MQPIFMDDGVARFKRNAIVRYMLDLKFTDLNKLAVMPFNHDDWTQFAQLIGYSVSGAGDLSYFDPEVTARADAEVERLLGKSNDSPLTTEDYLRQEVARLTAKLASIHAMTE